MGWTENACDTPAVNGDTITLATPAHSIVDEGYLIDIGNLQIPLVAVQVSDMKKLY